MLVSLAILGASGHGKVVADAAESAGWQDVVFFDDAWPSVSRNGTWKVVGTAGDLSGRLADFDGVTVAIGDNDIRWGKLDLLRALGANIVSVVHSSSTVSKHASIGRGAVILAGAVVNAGAVVGAGAILNTNAVVEHDCILGNACHVSPGAVLAGGVQLGARVWVGANACIRQLVAVGDNSTIGMGAVIVANVSSGAVMVGNPGRRLPC